MRMAAFLSGVADGKAFSAGDVPARQMGARHPQARAGMGKGGGRGKAQDKCE